ncbi:hypothetical protein GUITHDRAFT_119127 [Guillardia theta CCMP2712]|uniref:Uncharacterized protein n=1 Tax=Guillardia theta (strain CCMP2712) TaxID=905079 RepID=L1IFK5_GUITC|nr:hypothetical protein GUITHDRAFT_119127 [Guillardia theta CCMP2712]EKX34694.1 hypothetical protein GUITHDRAFT_119127 [Guillardia theta CCMP2712]|eukprot:XP_005821674.1 hypothetical protein GUITHDRAFT_119127 [Guillardia theta CCMP2712]
MERSLSEDRRAGGRMEESFQEESSSSDESGWIRRLEQASVNKHSPQRNQPNGFLASTRPKAESQSLDGSPEVHVVVQRKEAHVEHGFGHVVEFKT